MNVTIRPGVDFYRPLSFFLHAMDLTLSHLTLCLEAKKTGKIAKIAVPGRSWQSRNLISNATIDDGDESGSKCFDFQSAMFQANINELYVAPFRLSF